MVDQRSAGDFDQRLWSMDGQVTHAAAEARSEKH
jgi:hypothetical protein